MPPHHRRTAILLATTALTLGAAACGSSNTGPKTPSAHSLAIHFDSIYSSLLAQGTSADSLIAEYVAIYGETGPAYGAPLASFAVTTTSGTSAWNGFTYEAANTGAGGDSIFYTVIFNNLNLAQVVIARMNYSTSGTFASGSALAVLGLTTGGGDSTFTGSASVLSTGSSCSLQTGLQADSLLTVWTSGYACQSARFQISFQITFPTSANVGALSTVSITNAPFSGDRFYAAATGNRPAPIPSRAAALTMRLSALPLWPSSR
jgi:hypothetical protein